MTDLCSVAYVSYQGGCWTRPDECGRLDGADQPRQRWLEDKASGMWWEMTSHLGLPANGPYGPRPGGVVIRKVNVEAYSQEGKPNPCVH